MSRIANTVGWCYAGCLRNARIVQTVVAVVCIAALLHVDRFTFDASADSLVRDGDPELAYYENMVERFGEASFLVLTFTPEGDDVFAPAALETLAQLQSDLVRVEGVRSVTSVLDVPLLRSPPVPLTRLASDFRTLRSADVDLSLARDELTTSPLFAELLVSRDGATTALRIDLERDAALTDARAELERARTEGLGLSDAEARFREAKEANKAAQADQIARVRAVRDAYADRADLFLGGVPMVAADIIDFVRRDMTSFGLAMVGLMAVCLFVFFGGRMRWVLIPLGTVAVTLLVMIGLLGFLDEPATAISANFVALIAIIAISFTIHLITRYRELCISGFSDDHVALVYEAMRSKLAPCVYTGLTTAVAFASLLTSDIVPVVQFGWIMCVGILVAFLTTYSFFAGVLVLIPYSKRPSPQTQTAALTAWFGRLSVERPGRLLTLGVIASVVAAAGVSRLNLDNRFLEYFREGSEIRDGMAFIDERLGGTIPIDIVLSFPPYDPEVSADDEFGDDFEDDFEDGGSASDPYPERYWFTPRKLEQLERLEAHIASQPGMGKTVSVSTLERIARTFNDDTPLDYLQLTAVLALVPAEIRQQLIAPYASPATGELRISGRVHETGPAFSRDALIAEIKRYAVEELGFEEGDVRVTGMTVLFNDMLRQLFASQTSTLAFVVLATLVMFAVLLRSAALAVIGLLPNLLAAASVLAVMGFAGIPLDMMTISIAAIVIGIGVDDAIHYLHRFREERLDGLGTAAAIRAAHGSIGNALYFTSVTVFVGFSVLGFSNFVPTIYFGAMTALAMLIALVANLTVLPALLMVFYGDSGIEHLTRRGHPARRSNLVRRRTQMFKAIQALVWISLSALTPAAWSASADESVQIAVDRVLAAVESHRAGYAENPEPLRTEIASILDSQVDFDAISRGVLGRHAAALSAREKARFRDVFETAVIQLYAGALIALRAQQIEVRPAPGTRPGRAQVIMDVATEDGQTFELRYSMAQDGDDWRVRNIIVNGINLGVTYRNQFGQLFEELDGDVDAVIEAWATTVAEAAPDA